MEVKIYQTNNRDYSFMEWEWASKHGFNFERDYKEIYDFELPVEDDVDPRNFLDTIFEIFNIHRPEDFTGHSLSVSDIVKFDDRKFYCDSFGWKELNA